MRKYIITLLFGSIIVGTCSSQYSDQVFLQKIDSLKKLLPSAKSSARVDMLNDIARGLLWVYEDDERLLVDALKYADEAMQQAKKLNYKRGMGYSLVTSFFNKRFLVLYCAPRPAL